MFKEIPRYIEKALNILKNSGYEAFLVGGCVRDLIMGKTPNDYDITTNALPLQVKEIFNDFQTVDIGIKHGTVAVIIEKHNIEITTYRLDGKYTDNRHPESVVFVSNIADDLSRRDFTVNAIAYGDGELIDPFNGQRDIENKIIRCVGNPVKRFEEDALRIFRALRFSSVLNFSIEEKTKRACFQMKENLKNITVERLHTELNKMLLGSNIFSVLMEYYSIIGVIIPEIMPSVGFDQKTDYHLYDVWEHIARTVTYSPKSLVVRLTMFLHDIAKPYVYTTDKFGSRHFFGHAEKSADLARIILKRLKYDNKTIKTVTTLIRYHDHNNQNLNDPRIIKRLISIIGEENFFLLLDIKVADTAAKSPLASYVFEKCEQTTYKVSKILKSDAAYRISHLKINGNDLKPLGFKGKKISEMLNFLLNAVIEEEIENKKENLLIFAQKMLDKGF
ncbi:MAG: HD domain-containing protein [Oscillospiraceae bacterium]|jgi:tRNA nucleotidyltransferase (CCA-adding enzyme)|nr:HD domain-containing protein [Oscillospiraceae bacterium]